MQPDASRGNILIVDDTPDNLRLLSTMLTGQGYEVRSVINGAMALMGVGAEPPDLILLDINMPQMNGYEVCQQLKADDQSRDIPVIFISALEDVLDKVQAFAVGGVDYIVKPFQIEEVLARIETHLTVRRLQQQLQTQNLQLQQKMVELQELNQLKEEFLHAISHDLRTPIVGTLLVLENLQQKAQKQAEATVSISQSVLQRMIQSSDRQLSLLNLLLDAHFSAAGSLVLQPEPINLHSFVQGLTEDLEPLLAKNGATLTNRIAPELLSAAADPLQLRRVFENLLTNALNHNPAGLSLTVNATLSGATQSDVSKDMSESSLTSDAEAATTPETKLDMIYCTVQDNGIGINQAQRDRLFERYVRGDRTRSIGIGLGLYLCRQIIQAHGGEIGVTSLPGAGTTFWFTLPLAAQ
ncbi:hybrid sensor histidine kinase/response regulator [Trichocoleus sp. FACHB-262]|uniref:hybrid sensor histidine kinase/response regulator n=1 Tax=Trichocoleus sp. FACHB-262 TaxID=2692869 RepID=UPI001689A7F7|nr:hybrid sensor histidine kinase/response regulator [Trichocoleus sp. FACHB-262]MBD2120266.1 hybrid sensor histidine kinase/response regulator [Trichocoleus sp. FACHB-262]